MSKFTGRINKGVTRDMSVLEYLDLCKENPLAYASSAKRLISAIGVPKMVDTREDTRLSRIFGNKVIPLYPAFADFYGAEEVIIDIVNFLKASAQGAEERKQVLYLLGPVGGGKSSIAERLKLLMEKHPIYVLAAPDKHGRLVHGPIFESPLGLFGEADFAMLQGEYGIPRGVLGKIPSPWAVKRLRKEFDGDLEKFRVFEMYPSMLENIAISTTEPGDENNQDISALVGKIDIRKLKEFAQDDPDCYGYSGGLNIANQGLMEFVEMFKAPIKVLHPLLTATQEGKYKGTEGFSAMPFEGLILAHSNESEWKSFKNNKNNEAFLDRICVVKVPYCMRVTEEVKIYEKMIANTEELAHAPCAPGTLKMMAEFSVLSRLRDHENSSVFSKMRVYDGQNLKDTDPKAKSATEYSDAAGVDEGMNGISTRWAFKTLSKVFNFHHDEVGANPVHLLYVLEQRIIDEQFSPELQTKYLGYVKEHLAKEYLEFIGKEIQAAYLESYSEYGQNIFDRYVMFADFWIQDQDYRDPDTGEAFDRAELNKELEKIEKPAGISNPKDFRNEIVNFALRARANNGGKNPEWTSYEKFRTVIEKKMFSNTEELLPVLSYNAKASKEDQEKHEGFVGRMTTRGYTAKQVRLLSDWYMRARKSS